jgi:predicted lipid carrier protein YhbT
LIPREEIKSEIDPLWSIEIRQQNLGVCKDFDEEVIFEANLFVLVKLLQYTLVFVCLVLGFIQ